MAESYYSAIALAGSSSLGDVNNHTHRIAGKQRALEGHRIDADQRESDAMDAAAQNDESFG
jgi:hypothetical protein